MNYSYFNLTAPLKILRQQILDLLFPILCLSCGMEGSYLCDVCYKRLKRDEFQLCANCGSKSPFGMTHPACRIMEAGLYLGLDGLISAAPYKEPMARKLVETCKYKFVQDIAPILGSIISEEIANQEMEKYFQGWTLIPMPLHPSRLKWRGFNQSELIAARVSTLTNLPIKTTLLARRIKTKVQAELSDPERKLNVKDAFIATQRLDNRKYVLIDDVSTTRSTLTEACRALKSAGAAEVWAWTFAQG